MSDIEQYLADRGKPCVVQRACNLIPVKPFKVLQGSILGSEDELHPSEFGSLNRVEEGGKPAEMVSGPRRRLQLQLEIE